MIKQGFKSVLHILFFLFIWSCNAPTQDDDMSLTSVESHEGNTKEDTLYQSNNLVIIQISEHTYQHISYLNTQDFGRVSCNGMVVVNNAQSLIFDTPVDDEGSEELINYVTEHLNTQIMGIIPTHFHTDCIGGIATFHQNNIPVYTSNKTIQILKEKEDQNTSQIKGFDEQLILNLNNKEVIIQYFGEGHTSDNIIAYFPADNVMFGGCLIKELGANKGNLEDANTKDWPITVNKLMKEYPEAQIIIPGHGLAGGTDLLEYTLNLFK